MNILFYYPDKERAVSLSSLMIAFQMQGHGVFLLTHSAEGILHEEVKKHGIKTYTHQIKKNAALLFYLKHVLFLASFTKKNKIDIVYSHIQRANIISVFAQFISPARFIFCRHHSDCAYVDNNWKEKKIDSIINRFGKEFIVPSKKVYDQMVNVEKVYNKKIHLIRYAYDFEEYPKPNLNTISEIREKYACNLLLIKVARLIPEKRHMLLFHTVNQMVKKDMDVKLLVLSEGRERKNLEAYIMENNLHNNIFLLGYRKDVINYISAADLVVHVSESEASNNFIKEVGLCEKPVVVCKDVGDFDEYIQNNNNGIVLSKQNAENELMEILEKIYFNKISTKSLGENLKKDVLHLFGINNLIQEYKRFH